MQLFTTDKMPKPAGHYSQCVEHNGVLYISGQLPKDPVTKVTPEGIADQTLQVLKNIELILKEVGSNKNCILQMRIYIPDIEHWDVVNKVYSEFFGDHKPARCVVPSRDLHYGSMIEVEATAYLP
ncbi:MAG: RidA family protein [Cyclobacteriaceae bacterium]|nr:RidA family protein [Cyclobacteriaceae bacterium]